MKTQTSDLRGQGVIGSRDVIARIDFLEGEVESLLEQARLDFSDEAEFDETAWLAECDEHQELSKLKELAEEGSASPYWQYGETLIADSYFEDYARQLAEDIGAISGDEKWPANCIDWERAANELKQDYMSVEFDGSEYWIRA